MAEYIDREQLLELINEDCKYQNPTNEYTRGCNEVCDWAIKTIKNIPTADVVPKSEVEKALLDVEVMGAELSRYTENLMQMREQDKRNIAREIFEAIEFEIQQLDFDREETRAIAIEGVIAILKKKYTGVDNV